MQAAPAILCLLAPLRQPDSNRPYTRGSLIYTPGHGVQVLLHIASANFRAFTSLSTQQLTHR
eukprot:247965-Pelagomonas_calceolata.AAC.11